MTIQREEFRKALSGEVCIYPASIFDPISARIAEMVGYKFAMLPGSIASAVALVSPDLVLLTATELASQIRAITRATNLSLMVDADHCFGNALNVGRSVEEFEHAGAAAITVEDTVLPKTFGEPLPQIISEAEMIGKLRSALNSRIDPTFCIIARTISFAQEGPQEAVKRIKAYTECGVDAIFLAGHPRGAEDIQAACKATNLPLIVGRTTPELRDPKFLAENNCRFALEGQPPFRAALKATYEVMKFLKDGGSVDDLGDKVASESFFQEVIFGERYEQYQKDYLGF